MEKLLQFMTQTARGAGKIILEAGKEQIGIKTKTSFRDVVTKYDVLVQEYAIGQLREAFPDACFISEESDEVRGEKGKMVFVIDPIDGTANFSHHYRHSCISIGCVCDEEPEAAAVYDPYLDEMFTAMKGKGAFLNGDRLEIPQHTLQESLVLFGSSPYYMDLIDETFQNVKSIFPRCQDIRRSGSAALDLCYVANGRAGLFFESMLSVWDYAAGALIVRESGGICQSMDGTPLVFNRPNKSSVIAGSAAIIAQSGLSGVQTDHPERRP